MQYRPKVSANQSNSNQAYLLFHTVYLYVDHIALRFFGLASGRSAHPYEYISHNMCTFISFVSLFLSLSFSLFFDSVSPSLHRHRLPSSHHCISHRYHPYHPMFKCVRVSAFHIQLLVVDRLW